MSNKLTLMVKELLDIETDLPFRLKNKNNINDYELYTFSQTWGSTTLGFGGIGGQAMTTARTYVFVPQEAEDDWCYVYFAGRFAYEVPYSRMFIEDVMKRNVASVAMKSKYF